MCGIFGYVGNRSLGKTLTNGLKRLEYRGYDSAGIAVAGSSIKVLKGVGKVDEIAKALGFERLNGVVGIAHTRWATHGGVTETNAHPHVSCDAKVAVVHNGIIENYEELKEFLQQRGHTFVSETDTEVIPHLIEEFYNETKDAKQAVLKAAKALEGSFAFLAIFEDAPDRIFAVRYKSPLVVGVGDGENFVASDVPAFLEYTRKAIFLEDMEMAVITKNKVEVYDVASGQLKRKEPLVVPWSIQQAEKGGYEHFMIKEILEQKETLPKVLGQRRKVEEVAKIISESEKVFVVAAGTSYHAGLAFSYWLRQSGFVALPVIASEFESFLKLVDESSVVVAISQSGETADVLEAVRASKQRGAKIASIVNVVGSSLMRESDISLTINSGPEICVVATKSYTSQLALLYLLSKALEGSYDEGKKYVLEVASKLKKLLDDEKLNVKTVSLAKKLIEKEHVFLLGKYLGYVTALEGSLKIKEVSYVHAEGFAAGELKHGTLALIEQGTPCIALLTGKGKRDVLSNLMEVKARGAFTVSVCNDECSSDFVLKVPESSSVDLQLVLDIVPLQLLAYHMARLKGLDVDKPRNLAKSVTVK